MNSLDIAIKLRQDKKYKESRKILFNLIHTNLNQGEILLNIAWSYDNEGKENIALKYYIKSLKERLSEKDRFEALFGVACTYRCLKQYNKAYIIFLQLLKNYPSATEVIPFYALCLIDLHQKDKALQVLFKLILDYPPTLNIKTYKNAIKAYVEVQNELMFERFDLNNKLDTQ